MAFNKENFEHRGGEVYLPDPVEPAQQIGRNARIEINLPSGLPIEAADGSRLSGDQQIVFYSEANPVYASVDMIFLKGGEIVAQIPEASLYLLSFLHSTGTDDEILFDIQERFKDRTTRQYRFFARALAEYTACKVLLDIMRNAFADHALTSVRKALADFSIDTSSQGFVLRNFGSYMKEMRQELNSWRSAVYSGGAADHDAPRPQSAVKAGWNMNDNTPGIGRGWSVNGTTLNQRFDGERSGKTMSRGYRYADPRFYTTLIWSY